MTKVITLVEIDIDHCSLTYSVPPCQATLTGSPPTGTIKCFNSLGTCQDRANFTNVPVTYRFSEDIGFLPSEIVAFPFIQEIEMTPAILSLGEDLGQRATVRIRMRDARHSDAGPDFDKYLSERTYNPFEQGTFWGKFRARNPFLRGRPLRVLWGDVDQSVDTFETRLFLIDSFNGPDVNGIFEIIAKDVLINASSERAQAPTLSEGFLTSAVQTNSPITLSLTLSPEGAGDSYGFDGLASLGGTEIISFEADHRYLVAYIDFEPNGGGGALGSESQSRIFSGGLVDLQQDWDQQGNAAPGDTGSAAVGTGSLLLDGTGDYHRSGDPIVDAALAFGTEDWNIEFYVRLAALGTLRTLYDGRPNGVLGARPTIRVTSGNVLEYFTNGATQITGTTALQVDTWHRVRCSRKSGNTRLFLDHVQEGTTFVDAQNYLNGTNRPIFGADGNSLGANSVNGRLDHLIVEKGIGYDSDPSSIPVRTFADFPAGDNWEIVRAQEGTTAGDHSAQDRVQLVLKYTSQDPADIIYDLLVNYANVDPIYIPLAAWQSETNTFLGSQYTGVIAEPTSVAKLVGEIIEQAALSLWWDEVNHQIRLQVLRPVPSAADRFSEENILAQTLEVKEQPEKRISQVWTYFGQIDPTKPEDELDNYRSTLVTADLAAEADEGSPMIKKIFSRWIPTLGSAVAQVLNDIQLAMYRVAPRRFNFELLRTAETSVQMGSGYQLSHWSFQDDTGALVDVPILITKVEAATDRYVVEGEELLLEETDFGSPPTRYVIINADTNDFNFREAYDLLYADPVSGDVAVCRVVSGVTVGSTSHEQPAFTVGDWPAGVVVVVEIQADGRIQGRGGTGGTGSSSFSANGQQGDTGGTALYTRRTMTLVLAATSELWAGGGGGGGGRRGGTPSETGGGGGGGAGTIGGIGGLGIGVALNGSLGTSEAGGAGGIGASDSGVTRGGTGGTGGGPGLVGSTATGGVTGTNGVGGAAGNAVDGDSFVTYDGTGDIRGAQVN